LTVFATKIIVLLVARDFERQSIAKEAARRPCGKRGEVDRGRGRYKSRMANSCEDL
jgi:hypothetical protein